VEIQYTLSGLLLALTAALILEGALAIPLLFAWLIAINLFAFVFYGIDKLNSKSAAPGIVRIPEFCLLSLALAGGSPMALLAMLVFWHKIKKAGFMVSFTAILLAQGAIVYLLRDSIPVP
jgi:uncharacterized membrane protein YsdA (DUF1294 family)